MTTSLKKLLLISITLFLGVMSNGVRAQTTYDFTFSNDGSNDPGNVSGVFTVTSGYITGISGSVTGTSAGSGTLSSIYYVAPDHNIFSYPTTPYLDDKGVYFDTSIGKYELFYSVWNSAYYLTSITGCYNGCIGTLTVSPSVGAPEIDGSLAPKVGFLLGCLFLMFGRKKQNSEPMLTA